MRPDHLKSKTELLKEIEQLRAVLAGKEQQDRVLYGRERLLLNTTLFPIVISSLTDGRVLFINHIAAEYFGVSAGQAVGLSAPEYWIEPEQRDRFIERVEQHGEVKEFEAALRTNGGDIRHALLSANIVNFRGQRATCTIFADITQRKGSEALLRQSEEKYQHLYRLIKLMADTVPDMIWAKDLDDAFLFANRALCEKLLMCDPGESPLGYTDMFFAQRERARGHEHTFGEICVNSDEVVQKTQRPGRFLEHGKVRGKNLMLDVYKAPLFDTSGSLIGTVGTGRDVTRDVEIQEALRRSEQGYRLLAENVRDVIWTADERLNLTYVTPSIKQVSGYGVEEFLSLPVAGHLTQPYRQKFQAALKLLVRARNNGAEGANRVLEFECRRKDGSTIWVETMISPLRGADGSFTGYTGVIRDATKRVQDRLELEQAKEVALAASRTKSEFLANMSHEIRTPLNGVLGLLQLLRETPLTRNQQEYVDTALGSGTGLLKIISDILDFSKVEAGKIELVQEAFALEPLLQSVLASFDCLAGADSLDMRYEVDTAVPEVVIGDPSRLKQILFNLVGNAVKFTPQGTVAVTLTCLPESGSDRLLLRFRISDTGVGIPKHLAENLFEPFVQADGTIRRTFGGTGLGLSIVRQLVTLMDGAVRLERGLERGTVVWVEVFARRAPRQEQPDLVNRLGLFSSLPARHILVVEDDSINAMVVSGMLEKLGQTVTLVSSGEKALDLLTTHRFDCIFMDIQMPEMDGIEVTGAIREHPLATVRTTPIVALTAHAMKGDRERFLASGMDGYLSKPLELAELSTVLRDLPG